LSVLQHVGLRVDDLETAVSFYQEVLDAAVVVQPISMRPTGAAGFMNGPPDTEFRFAMLGDDLPRRPVREHVRTHGRAGTGLVGLLLDLYPQAAPAQRSPAV
jgi:catechol 2,3-dioxygenase-like lactoylglutathione lyase family enzyme